MPGPMLGAKETDESETCPQRLMICFMPPKLDWGLPEDEDSDLILLWVPITTHRLVHKKALWSECKIDVLELYLQLRQATSLSTFLMITGARNPRAGVRINESMTVKAFEDQISLGMHERQ